MGCGDCCRGDVCLDVGRTKDCQIVADAHYLPFQDGLFDGIHGQCVFEHLEKPTQALKDFLRVLKPGGKIVFLVPKPWLTNNCFSKLFKVWLDPFWWLPQNLIRQIRDLRRIKRESRFRHKSIITHRFMVKTSKGLGFSILEEEAVEDLLLNSLNYFHKRNLMSKIFRFKPKFFHLTKFVLQKNC